ncbi:MAG: 3-oxoacyl-ACP reductase FabG [Kiritimatiellae bacterium]|nr:3-oxoacyl-ACP reductase FabG [Kiritimatiellia bacterium]
MNLGLKDKVVLVTGASRGIGKAIALVFAEEGAKVAVNYLRNAQMAQDVVDQIKTEYGVDAMAVGADVGHEKAIIEMFDKVEAELGPMDILVNNSAYCPGGPLESYTVEEWEKTFAINVTGYFVASKDFVRRLRERKAQSGRIINVASQAAFLGSTSGHLPYDSSKGAVVSMTRAIARETAPEGITVNAVAPGMVMTEMVAKLWEERKDRYLSRMPIGRIAEPVEVANAIAFLASDQAAYITGTTMDLTGGLLMR